MPRLRPLGPLRLGLLVALAFGPAALAAAQDNAAPARTRRPTLSERRGVTPPPGDAEAKPATPSDAPAADPKPAAGAAAPDRPSFLGDTSKFTRYSGWGSMGGALGQFGVAKSMLVNMPAVQKELKITDEQKAKIHGVQVRTRERGEELGRSMRARGEDPAGEDGEGQGQDQSVLSRVNQFTTMMGRVSDLMRENDDAFGKVLTASQRKRLDQIALQMEGVMALTRPEVADALGLFPVEQEEIQQIVARSRMTQMTSMVGAMMRMRSRMGRDANPPGGPGDRPRPDASDAPNARTPDPAQATDKPKEKDGERKPAPTVSPEERARREKAMREQFTTLRDGNDKIQDQAVREILRFLNKAQKAKFAQMLGPPFDPNQLTEIGRPPRAGEKDAAGKPGPR